MSRDEGEPLSRRLRFGIVLALVGAMFAGVASPAAEASHRRRYRQLQEKIAATRDALRDATRREHVLMDRLADSDRRRASLERRLALINDQLSFAVAKLDALTARLDRVTAELAWRNAQLEEASATLEEQTQIVNDRAKDIYTMGTVDYTTIMFTAEDMNSLVVGYEYARSVLGNDAKILDEVQAAKDGIESARLVVERKKREVSAAVDAQETATRHIAAIRNSQAAARREVVSEISHRRRLLADVRSEKEAYERALASYMRESDSISNFLRGRQAGQGVVQGQGGYLKWPVSGPITSPYGWRTHPIYHKRSFHTGIDIGSAEGSTVRAARRGVVLYTGYRGAYGLIAIIDHGDSLATLYAHMSRVYVREGETLDTQESVGAVGCTGWCTGPHVHFEVRVSGEPQDPMRWL